jgi:hypothetical protein
MMNQRVTPSETTRWADALQTGHTRVDHLMGRRVANGSHMYRPSRLICVIP